VKAATQKELEGAILLMLAEEAQVSSRRLKARQIAAKFVPPIGETQVQIALNHLAKIGFVDSNFDNMHSIGSQITRNGILHVEEKICRRDVGENSKYTPSSGSSGWDSDEKDRLEEQGTYVLPVPPEDNHPSDAGPASVIIHNHVNPTINNTITGLGSGTSNSAAWASWFSAWGTWAGVAFAILAIVVTLKLAGKF
jgi:hypothetical protein